jgi:diguanylate cyclase (GGDEF)-like protein
MKPLDGTIVPRRAPAPGETVEELKERIALLEAVIDNFPGGLLLFDRHLHLVLCNAQQRKLLEYPDALFANGNPHIEDIFRFNARRGEYGPGDPEQIVGMRMDLVRQRCVHVFERTRPNGVIVEIRGVPLKDGGFVTTYLDVTEQRRNQALIQHFAFHDQLTDLPNRVLFIDRLNQALARVKRGETIALHYIDLDGFKPVNDKYGQEAGDEVLVTLARSVAASVRRNEIFFRLGGDEFAVLAPDSNENDMLGLARRVNSRIAELRFRFAGQEVGLTASLGIAVYPVHAISGEEIIARADYAMYQAKANGRNRCQVYQDPMVH